MWTLPTPYSVSTACKVAPLTVRQRCTREYSVRSSTYLLLAAWIRSLFNRTQVVNRPTGPSRATAFAAAGRFFSWRGPPARLIGPPHHLLSQSCTPHHPNLAAPARIAGTKNAGLVFWRLLYPLAPGPYLHGRYLFTKCCTSTPYSVFRAS
jgi:hypothetical protein